MLIADADRRSFDEGGDGRSRVRSICEGADRRMSRWLRRSPRLLPSEMATTTGSEKGSAPFTAVHRKGAVPLRHRPLVAGAAGSTSPRRILPSEWRPSISVRPSSGLQKHAAGALPSRQESTPASCGGVHSTPSARARRPAFDKRLLRSSVGLDDRRPRPADPAGSLTRAGMAAGLPRQRGDGVGQPLQMHVLTAEHLLIGVVGVVGRDRTRVRLPRDDTTRASRDRTPEGMPSSSAGVTNSVSLCR